MNIEDIRLTPEHVKQIYLDMPLSSTWRASHEAVANTATDKCLKKMIEHLEDMNLAKNHPNCFMMALEDWETLKELVKEG